MKFPTFAAAFAFILRHWWKTCRFLFRFLIRGTAILVTLLVLLYAVTNWWGAGKRRESIARLKASGLPMTPADFDAAQPADRENFAMIPLLKSAARQAFELADEAARTGNGRRTQPGPELLLIRTMGDPALADFIKTISRIHRAGNPDFSKLEKDAGYGLSAESFLAEYDLRNTPALEQLREGMSRPRTSIPLFTPGFQEDLQNASSAFYFDLKKAATGLCLRADAALQTGNSDKAAESLVLALRLGEMVGSKGFFVSPLLENAILTEADRRLARGIRQHRWTEKNLNDLRSALVRMDLRGHVVRSFEANTYYRQVWWNWSDHRPRGGSEAIDEIWSSYEMPFEISQLPSGWFDANGAIAVNHALDFAQLVRSPGPLKRWTDLTRPQPEDSSKIIGSKFFGPAKEYDSEKWVVYRCAYMLVLRSQALLAIKLEKTRFQTGCYPDTLEAIDARLTIDPLFEIPFRYRKTEDSFQLYSIGPDGVDNNLNRKPGKMLGEIQQADWAW